MVQKGQKRPKTQIDGGPVLRGDWRAKGSPVILAIYYVNGFKCKFWKLFEMPIEWGKKE